MVTSIRIIEKEFFEKKIISISEKKNIKFVRKSIFANQIINKGEKISEKNLVIKRPANGLFQFIGKKLLNSKP